MTKKTIIAIIAIAVLAALLAGFVLYSIFGGDSSDTEGDDQNTTQTETTTTQEEPDDEDDPFGNAPESIAIQDDEDDPFGEAPTLVVLTEEEADEFQEELPNGNTAAEDEENGVARNGNTATGDTANNFSIELRDASAGDDVTHIVRDLFNQNGNINLKLQGFGRTAFGQPLTEDMIVSAEMVTFRISDYTYKDENGATRPMTRSSHTVRNYYIRSDGQMGWTTNSTQDGTLVAKIVVEVEGEQYFFFMKGYCSNLWLIVRIPPQPTTTIFDVVKNWLNDAASNRPSSIQVELYRNGVATGQRLTLNAGNNWSGRWTGLEIGHTYTAREVNVPSGYTASYSHSATRTVITNTFTPPPPRTITITIIKEWRHGTNPVANHPAQVTFANTKNGTRQTDITVNAAGNWRSVIRNVLPTDDYRIWENAVPGYTTADPTRAVDGNGNIVLTFVNTFIEPITRTFTWDKTWANDTASNRPQSLSVQLYRGRPGSGTAVGNPVQVTANMGWSYTWTGLQAGDYYAREVTVPTNYTASNADSRDRTVTTNTFVPPTVSYDVEKVYVGGVGPAVTVELLRNGTATGNRLTLNAGNGWKGSWTGLEAGHTYTAREVSVPSGYTVSYSHSATRTVVTNTFTPPPTTSHTVVKHWDHGTNTGSRPSSAQFVLWNTSTNSQVGSAVTLSSSNSWTYTWSGLDASFSYEAREINAPANYSVSYSRSATRTVATNVFIPPFIPPVDPGKPTGDDAIVPNPNTGEQLTPAQQQEIISQQQENERLNREREQREREEAAAEAARNAERDRQNQEAIDNANTLTPATPTPPQSTETPPAATPQPTTPAPTPAPTETPPNDRIIDFGDF
ncbi:Cna B-type domain-containing protein [Candidatus Saccharibacteria bacterium]|nr:Cna B-type domain-containing protein [Candidatus Saccharibacteria bacterium]